MRFEFATAARIIFGGGVLHEVGTIAVEMGTRILVATRTSTASAAPLFDELAAHHLSVVPFTVNGEPTVELVREGTRLAKQGGCDMVIGFGGGSVIDTGKAIAAMLTNPGEVLDYLEVIGKGRLLSQPAAPYIAIPTTAGTGSEVTRNAVLASTEHRVKVSLRSTGMLPRVALIDPQLTYSMPPALTVSTGLDALTQVIEPFVSNKPNALTDPLCREGIHRAARSLRQAYEHGDDVAAREDMALTSLFGGLALANGKLGAVHGFAGPLGGLFPAPHGAVCGRLLPFVMEMNLRALQARSPENEALSRYDEVARILTGREKARAIDGVTWIKELCAMLRIPALSVYGVTVGDLSFLVDKSSVASSMQGNPIKLTSDEMREILEKASDADW
jgi:alcohol dehydrogenase class IV